MVQEIWCGHECVTDGMTDRQTKDISRRGIKKHRRSVSVSSDICLLDIQVISRGLLRGYIFQKLLLA